MLMDAIQSNYQEFCANPSLLEKQRLHLRHGPIELLIKASGMNDVDDTDSANLMQAYAEADSIFPSILLELAQQLPLLRTPISANVPQNPQKEFKGAIAIKMWQATHEYAGDYITPMAAVAGAVADYMLENMRINCQLKSVYINNGGDIALYNALDSEFTIAICGDLKTGALMGSITITGRDNIGGVASSGWQGRSHSLGIADVVTVLAKNAAMADAAATMIANRVNLPNDVRIMRGKANILQPDSDLGEREVTIAVPPLGADAIQQALDAGVEFATKLLNKGLISAAFLNLQSNYKIVGDKSKLASISLK